MNEHLRKYMRQQRELKGLSVVDLARMVGYRKRCKGAKRILQFEETGEVTRELLKKLAQALELEEHHVTEAMEMDRAAWEVWVNAPVPIMMQVRKMAWNYIPHAVPETITTSEGAKAYARQFAEENHLRICIELSRRESVWIGEDGEILGRTLTKPEWPNVHCKTFRVPRELCFGFVDERV